MPQPGTPQLQKHRGAPSMLVQEVYAHPAHFSRVLPLALRRVPLLFTAIAFAAGVCASQLWRPAAVLVAGTAAMLVVSVVAIRKAARLAPATVLLTWLVLGWTMGILQPRSVPDPALLPYTDGVRRDVLASVAALRPLPAPAADENADPQRPFEQANDREAAAAAEQRFTADLQLQQIEHLDPDVSALQPVSGTVRIVMSAADAASLQCGATLRATLRLYRPRAFRDPGVWSYSGWLAEHDVTATGTAVVNHVHLQSQGIPSIPCRLQQARTWASHRLSQFAEWQRRSYLPAVMRWTPEDAAAWSAMLFGDRSALAHSLRNNFERTGTFHLFVVSGMHIGLVAAGVFWLMERMRLPRVAAALCTAITVTGYALLTGFGPPVQRALVMTLAFLLAESLARQRNTLNAIGAAALAMLVLQPQVFRESSFQMTVLIAVTIAGIAVPLLDRTIAPYARACDRLTLLRLDRRLPPHVAQFRVLLRWCMRELEQSVGRLAGSALLLSVRAFFLVLIASILAVITELTMSLPMAFYFHRFTVLALPANLLVMPLLAPLMVCGIATFVLCLVSYPLAWIASAPAALLLHATAWIVRWLAAAGGADLRTPGPPLLAAIGLITGIAACIVLLRSARRPIAWLGVAIAIAVAAGTGLLARRSAPKPALQITAIDVGQGDSILLTAPSGQSLLIDAGGMVGSEQDARKDGFDIGEQVVSPYLWQRGIARLDVLALSHAHMDHLGGMRAVLHNFRPHELWLSVDVPSPMLHALIDDAHAQGTAVRWLRAGTSMDWQTLHLDVLAPDAGYSPAAEPGNDDSLVLRATYGKASALLAGDAEQPSEQAMLDAHLLLPVTLLKVGHHGSLTSSSDSFLDALSPKVAIISCGRGNHFGHPRMPVLARLQERHVATARTDTMGAVEYTLGADGIVVTTVPAAVP